MDNQLSKNIVDDELDKNTVFRLDQSLENNLKISCGNDVYNLSENDEKQTNDTTICKAGSSGVLVLPFWKIVCNDKNNNGKTSIFVKTPISFSQTINRGANSLSQIGKSFMYKERQVKTIPA